MSELKVNKITPKTGTSIQLGESGDTITIPCGATLTNNGTATGFGLSFCTTVKTSPFTATANKGFLINTGSAVTVTLPASPSTGDELIFVDQTGQAATNNITLGRNGSKIKGICTDGKMVVNRGGLRLVYSGSSQGWITATAGNDDSIDQNVFITASGGCVATVGDYKIHTFNSDANFVVSAGLGPVAVVDYLVVAGGAGGGGDMGGGGGAGGYRESVPSPAVWTGSPIANPGGAIAVSAQTYPVTIGGGGSGGGAGAKGSNGSNSVFSTITSAGGGAGGSAGPNAPPAPPGASNASAGGSGGGQRAGFGPGSGPEPGGAGNTPPVSPPQGNPGGKGFDGISLTTNGGGGGGSGAAGDDAVSPQGGNGGAGVTSTINNTPTARAGGGGGGSDSNSDGSGGSGGGGGAGAPTGTAGSTNTGGGAGGGSAPGNTGGAGGSGVVIIRYKYQ
jgi:hypothetical protein